MKRILIALAIAGICCAQTASVYDISDTDAAEGRKLLSEKNYADNAYEAYLKRIQKRYAQSGEELNFTPDFKHAIAHPSITLNNITCGSCWIGSPAIAVLPCAGVTCASTLLAH